MDATGMTMQDLCERFGVSPRTIHDWVQRDIVPRPFGGRGRNASYGQVHVEAIEAWLAHHHHFVSGKDALEFCRENGITLREYHLLRERAIRDFGIGVA
jgi:phage terminase Nu1 subunit (DNA packaging protein)